MTKAQEACSCAGVSNVLDDHKRRQVLALGRLGWSLRHIEEATEVRRETASATWNSSSKSPPVAAGPGSSAPRRGQLAGVAIWS